MRALSIRQPYVEEILLGLKRIEYRHQPVSADLMNRRFYLYAAQLSPTPADIAHYCRRSWDLADLKSGLLPTGLLLGSAIIDACTFRDDFYEWHLTEVRRLRRPLKPTKQPQPIWWWPFDSATT